ncbi:hypothetical protein JOD67_006763 [Tenggerimyces flavus]|nr:hypothetical protein [Tenggerimyces flavus]
MKNSSGAQPPSTQRPNRKSRQSRPQRSPSAPVDRIWVEPARTGGWVVRRAGTDPGTDQIRQVCTDRAQALRVARRIARADNLHLVPITMEQPSGPPESCIA